MANISAKQRAKREAAGETFLRSTIAPKQPRSITSERKPTSKSGKPRRKKREAEETARIYGPQQFRDWLHRQCCSVCAWQGNTEQAHAATGGMGRKASWTASLPLCGPHPTLYGGHGIVEGCHRESHRTGVKSFEAKHGVNLIALAAKTRANYLRESTRSET